MHAWEGDRDAYTVAVLVWESDYTLLLQCLCERTIVVSIKTIFVIECGSVMSIDTNRHFIFQIPMRQEWKDIERSFWTKWKFPGCARTINSKPKNLIAPDGTVAHNEGVFERSSLAQAKASNFLDIPGQSCRFSIKIVSHETACYDENKKSESFQLSVSKAWRIVRKAFGIFV